MSGGVLTCDYPGCRAYRRGGKFCPAHGQTAAAPPALQQRSSRRRAPGTGAQLDAFAALAAPAPAPEHVPPPPAQAVDVSRDAARAAVESGKAALDRWRLVAHLYRAEPSGLTAAELELRTGLDGNSVRPRLWELANAEPAPLVERTLARRIVAGHRSARVYRLTSAGMARATAAEQRRAQYAGTAEQVPAARAGDTHGLTSGTGAATGGDGEPSDGRA